MTTSSSPGSSLYVDDVEIATVRRVLETLRAAMNWGMAQTPPLFNKSPFYALFERDRRGTAEDDGGEALESRLRQVSGRRYR